MSKPPVEKPTKANKDQIVRYRCERPLIVDFDSKVAQENKTRSEVLRELMAGWVKRRKAA